MTIKKFTFGPFGTNTYVVSEGETAMLVDCACWDMADQDELEAYLQRAGLTPTLLICTHGHLDHLWGAKWACEKWGLTAYVHPNDFTQIENLARQQASFGILPRDTEFPYGDITKVIPFEGSTEARNTSPFKGVRGVFTPGHTQGSVCLYNEAEGVLLSGDTWFDGGYGRTDLPGGNYMQLMQSLERLAKLPSGTWVLPGHGGEFRV